MLDPLFIVFISNPASAALETTEELRGLLGLLPQALGRAFLLFLVAVVKVIIVYQGPMLISCLQELVLRLPEVHSLSLAILGN